MNFPLLVFFVSFTILALSAKIGDSLRRRTEPPKEDVRTDSGLLLSATLTLLYFIIGFSFSMSISRYDVRKNCELAEAQAIGTAHVRSDLLAPADAMKTGKLLKEYLDQRLLFYTVRAPGRRVGIAAETARLQGHLWSTVRQAVPAVPPPLMGLLVSGINDVVASQRSTEAAWLNRIPIAAWALMAAIAIGTCWLIGYRARRTDWLAFLIVPVAASVSFFLIADLDSPLGGAIRVNPYNLSAVAQSFPAQEAAASQPLPVHP
jgi:hypothetical protein